jgi:hypothetical protein
MTTLSDPVHVRTITMQARRAGDALLAVSGRLVDERPQGAGVGWFGAVNGSIIHDMRVTLGVRHPDLVITSVTAEMASHPYSLCPDAVEPLQQLVGLSIARGFTRALNERFGRLRASPRADPGHGAGGAAGGRSRLPRVRRDPENRRRDVVREHVPGVEGRRSAPPATGGGRPRGAEGALG